MTQPLVECVPNFSEGRDPAVIARITDAIDAVDGVTLLDVDPGESTNRTVVTFVGPPDAVVEAAVGAGITAAESIDMRSHHGEHPRFGAMDVCPLVPVAGITMDEVADLAREVGRRLGEAGISVYLYEHAASAPHRRNLADVRAGEYEGLPDKLQDPQWRPDYGPTTRNDRAGATAVGARGFLIAYNVNLNTTSTRRANAVAFDVRERGRIRRDGDPLTGPIVRDRDGYPEWVPGSLQAVKAIGWYLEEYGIAQISMNLTDISVTPIHTAFDEVCDKAAARGMRVTGSEIVGMVPLRALLDAGRHYLRKQHRSTGVPDEHLIHVAVRSLGLDDLAPFDPDEKIIEYRLGPRHGPLAAGTVAGFVTATASEAPAPGGGASAALAGALGAALGAMVANVAAHKRGWDDRWEEFSDWAERGTALHGRLLALADDDTAAFDAVLAAHRLPAGTPDEERARAGAIERATLGAIETPLAVMEAALEAFEVLTAMAAEGTESSVSDAGVGALLARSAVRGAGLNVRINAAGLADPGALLDRAEALEAGAARAEAEVLAIVERRIAGS
ncbi:MAG: glutamate formimidoyltransferase [Actinobacteria bacterium]|nr:glutamate formimidoyltransferase [Actinomycetota bacterium]